MSNVITHSYSSGNVGTSAYVEITPSTPISCSKLELTDSSGKMVIVAKGLAGSEVDLGVCPVSGSIVIPIYLPPGTRLSLKAIDASATTGFNAVSLIG